MIIQLSQEKSYPYLALDMSMIIDVMVASTSRFQKFGPTDNPELAEDLSGKVILEKIKAEGYCGSYKLLPDGIDIIREAVGKSEADAIVIMRGHWTYSSGPDSRSR